MVARILLRCGLVAGSLITAPIYLRDGTQPTVNVLKAEDQCPETCCPEQHSICNFGAGEESDHYYNSSGPCPS